ncbi:MAG: hypothetical protein J2P48_21035 [Alphaproteobacteria bacterium]|nr:hypothetical protein [Alphaproteobacteria bacterium]
MGFSAKPPANLHPWDGFGATVGRWRSPARALPRVRAKVPQLCRHLLIELRERGGIDYITLPIDSVYAAA